jgi:uncharacterized protein (UPF0261 family)
MPELPIALSTGPQTRTVTKLVTRLLAERGRAVRTYEADGIGGRQLETDVLAGRIAAVLDLTLTELAAELLGLPAGAGPDRLTAAGMRGLPQVIAPGGLDCSPELFDRLGQEIANKASAAAGPVTILVPSQMASPILAQSLHNWLSPRVRVRHLDCDVNDPAFAAAAVEALETQP